MKNIINLIKNDEIFKAKQEIFEKMDILTELAQGGAKTGVKIKVKNPGILEVPEDENVWDLGKKDIIDLAKRKGREKISRAVTNLKVWHKNDTSQTGGNIRVWANKAIEWLRGEFDKDEKER